MVHTLRFFSFNSNVLGSCIIHILYTGVLKLEKKSGAESLMTYKSLILARTDSFLYLQES